MAKRTVKRKTSGSRRKKLDPYKILFDAYANRVQNPDAHLRLLHAMQYVRNAQ